MTEASLLQSRPSRERKATQRLEPEKAKENKGFSYVAGMGTPLGDIPFFRHASDKLAGDDDVLILLHTLFFGSAGKHTMRKRQIRQFSGFPEDSPSRTTLVDKITNSKKWTVSALKSAAGLFGLEKGGSRDEIVGRFVDFIIRPSELKSVPAAKVKKSKKRTLAGGKKSKKEKSDKPKRAATPYILFSLAKRDEIKAQNPEAAFGDIAKLLGAAWKALGEAEKAVWVSAAAAAAAATDDAGGQKKRRKVEVAEEESSEDEESEEEDAGEDDRDKDLFPDSDEEA